MRRRLARDTGALAAGTLLNGVLAYVFFALVTRDLGAATAAPVSVLWTYWGAAGAVATFPLQHWTIRTIAAAGESSVARAMPRIFAGTIAAAVLSGAVAYSARWVLFDSGSVAFPLLLAAVTLGACFMGMVRGALAGRQRFIATAVAMAGENAVRLAAAAVVALTAAGAVAYGGALALGSAVGLVWLGGLRFARDGGVDGEPRAGGGQGSGLAAGSIIAQVVLTGGPVVLASIGGAPAEITSLFVALALWRAPYLLALGLTTQLTGFLTHLVVSGRTRQLHLVRWATVGAIVAGGAAAAALAGVSGSVLQAVFGDDVVIERGLMALLGAGSAFAVGNLVLLLLLLARGLSRYAGGAWLCGLLVAAGVVALAPAPPLDAVVWAFVLAQATAFTLMILADVIAASRPVRQGMEIDPVATREPLPGT